MSTTLCSLLAIKKTHLIYDNPLTGSSFNSCCVFPLVFSAGKLIVLFICKLGDVEVIVRSSFARRFSVAFVSNLCYLVGKCVTKATGLQDPTKFFLHVMLKYWMCFKIVYLSLSCSKVRSLWRKCWRRAHLCRLVIKVTVDQIPTTC